MRHAMNAKPSTSANATRLCRQPPRDSLPQPGFSIALMHSPRPRSSGRKSLNVSSGGIVGAVRGISLVAPIASGAASR
jgi:hypothetical protein